MGWLRSGQNRLPLTSGIPNRPVSAIQSSNRDTSWIRHMIVYPVVGFVADDSVLMPGRATVIPRSARGTVQASLAQFADL